MGSSADVWGVNKDPVDYCHLFTPNCARITRNSIPEQLFMPFLVRNLSVCRRCSCNEGFSQLNRFLQGEAGLGAGRQKIFGLS